MNTSNTIDNNIDTNTISQYTIDYTITIEEAEIIALWIIEENKLHGKHMLEKTVEEIYTYANTYGCCAIKHNNQIIGFIDVMPVTEGLITLYERGSLFVHPDHRKKGLGFLLIQNMLSHKQNVPMYSITNVSAVKKINTHLKQTKYTKEELPKEILSILEQPAPLLDDDVVYVNITLKELLETLS